MQQGSFQKRHIESCVCVCLCLRSFIDAQTSALCDIVYSRHPPLQRVSSLFTLTNENRTVRKRRCFHLMLDEFASPSLSVSFGADSVYKCFQIFGSFYSLF